MPGMIVVPVGKEYCAVPFHLNSVYTSSWSNTPVFQADERVVNFFEGGTGTTVFLRLVIDDILVAGGIVHDERAGEPGKMGGEFVADPCPPRSLPVPPLSRAPGGTAEIQAFFHQSIPPYGFSSLLF